jgi:hypothetical protein
MIRRALRLAVLASLALALWRWAGELARSWAAIWEHYHQQVAAGYGTAADRERYARELDAQVAGVLTAFERRTAADIPTPRVTWPAGELGDPGPYPYRFELGPGGRVIDHADLGSPPVFELARVMREQLMGRVERGPQRGADPAPGTG